jgi:ankyrin repeat protein/Ca2+-binding EF-hand superfamily protein
MNEVDSVYSLLLRMVKSPRPRTVSIGMASPPPDQVSASEKDAALEKLKAFVAIYNDTIVHRLLNDGKLEDAKKVLEKAPALYRLGDVDGDTLLHVACRNDRYDFVRFMMMNATKKGGFYWDDGGEALFDPNARNHARWTPLHCAAFGFHFKICDLLLKEAPISVNCITEPNRSSPLHFLARFQDTAELMANNVVADPSTLASTSSSYRPQVLASGSKDNLALSSVSLLSSASGSTVLKDMIEVLNGLLDAGADLSARDAKGETPLHIAANLGSIIMAEWLILNRADVNAISFQNQETPLHMAIKGKNPIIVEMLLGANADVSTVSKHGTPLELAQQFSSPDIIRLLKEHTRSLPINHDTQSDVCPHLDTSESPPGVPLSPRQLSRTPPTMSNSTDGTLSAPGTPSSSGTTAAASLNQGSEVGAPVVTTAVSLGGSIQVQEHALLVPPGSQPAASAPIFTGTGNPAADSSQSSSGAQTSNDGLSFTSIAASLPSIAALPLMPFKAVKRVVETALFSPGRTPLHEAVIQNNDKLVAEILRMRPNLINTKDQQRWTPMLYAAAYGHLRLMMRLTRCGADLTSVDSDESGILHFLARNRRVGNAPLEFADLLDILVLHHVNLDQSNMFGATALHEAASRNNLVVLHSLCQRGAKVDALSKLGETPLIYAARENCVDSVNFLLHRGANMDHSGKYGSAVEVARNCCNVSVLKVFLFYKTQSTPSLLVVDEVEKKNSVVLNSSGSSTPTGTTTPAPRSLKLRSLSKAEPFVGPTTISVPAPAPSATAAVVSYGHTSPAPGSSSFARATRPSTSPISGSPSEFSSTPPRSAPKIELQSSLPKRQTSEEEPPSDFVEAMEDADLGDIPIDTPSFSSFLSPRRHLTVTVDGAVIDYNKVYGIHEPLLAAFPCSCTINSPMAVFKDTEGFIIVWQHHIAFGHVATTSTGALVADSSFNWKVPFTSFATVALVKSMFSSTRIAITVSSPGTPLDTPNISITLGRCERMESLEKLLQYLFTNRHVPDRLEIEGVPIADMVGSILYPKENAEFHRQLPGLPISETVLEYFSCYYKEEGAFASKMVYVSQHRICFGKKNLLQIPFEDIKTLKKADTKTIVFETPTQKYTFSSITNRDAVFSLVESLWNAQQSDNRLVLFGALGRRTMQMCELFIEKYAKTVNGPELYVRWVLIQGYHVLDKRQQEMLRDIGVEVVWLSSRSGYTAIPEVLQYMRKVAFLYLDFDPKFLEVAEMILLNCNPKQMKQIILVSLSLGNQGSYFGESVAQLQDLCRETEVGFVFMQCQPAFMQILEDEFVDIKRDWRFRLPWPGTNPKLSWLDMRDVVDVTVEIAASNDVEQHKDKYYFISGPESLSCDDIAAAITQLTEQEVRFIGVSMDEIKTILVQSLAEATSVGPRITEKTQQSLSRTLSMEQYLPAIVTHDMAEVHSFASNTSSSIVKSIKAKLSQFESQTELDFDTQQYLLIFGDLSTQNLHSITSTLTVDLISRRPRTIHNFVIDHLESFRAKGAYNFTSQQKEASSRHFSDLAVSLAQASQGKIDVAHFSKMVSPIFTSNCPSFANRLARLFNPTGRTSMILAEYQRICSTLVNGEQRDQLSLSCDLFDSDQDQIITSQDIADVAAEMCAILTSLGIEYNAFSVRSILSAKGLANYPREAPVHQTQNHSAVGVSLASTDRPLRHALSSTEFCLVLKSNRNALSSLGCLSALAARPEKIALKQRRNGIYVCPGHPLWETTLRLSTGISHTIQAQMTQGTSQIGELSEKDCDLETEFRVSGPTEPEVWTFHEYGGPVFRKIRETCGVAVPDYLASLGIEMTLGNLVLGKLANFEEISSSGRSGSFFLRSHNTKLLIKSLPIDEHTFLKKNLWKYYRHIRDNPDTLLVRFFGLYRVKSASREVHFVIMANLFDTPLEIHEQYDLKGSTVNRYVGDKMPFWSPNIAMKDLDFHRFIHIGPERKAQFIQQAEIDSIFMETFNICDYSLLVGFNFSDSSTVDSSLPKSPMGSLGFMACSPSFPEEYITYYLCNLIDILTQYNLKKRGESAIKSIVHKKVRPCTATASILKKHRQNQLAHVLTVLLTCLY